MGQDMIVTPPPANPGRTEQAERQAEGRVNPEAKDARVPAQLPARLAYIPPRGAPPAARSLPQPATREPANPTLTPADRDGRGGAPARPAEAGTGNVQVRPAGQEAHGQHVAERSATRQPQSQTSWQAAHEREAGRTSSGRQQEAPAGSLSSGRGAREASGEQARGLPSAGAGARRAAVIYDGKAGVWRFSETGSRAGVAADRLDIQARPARGGVSAEKAPARAGREQAGPAAHERATAGEGNAAPFSARGTKAGGLLEAIRAFFTGKRQPAELVQSGGRPGPSGHLGRPGSSEWTAARQASSENRRGAFIGNGSVRVELSGESVSTRLRDPGGVTQASNLKRDGRAANAPLRETAARVPASAGRAGEEQPFAGRSAGTARPETLLHRLSRWIKGVFSRGGFESATRAGLRTGPALEPSVRQPAKVSDQVILPGETRALPAPGLTEEEARLAGGAGATGRSSESPPPGLPSEAAARPEIYGLGFPAVVADTTRRWLAHALALTAGMFPSLGLFFGSSVPYGSAEAPETRAKMAYIRSVLAWILGSLAALTAAIVIYAIFFR